MPHLGGDLFADVACVLARADDAAQDGGAVAGVEGHGADEGVRVALPLHMLRIAERLQHALPAAVGGAGALVEHQRQVHVEQAHGVLGALQITGHPVQTVGDAGEHGNPPWAMGCEWPAP